MDTRLILIFLGVVLLVLFLLWRVRKPKDASNEATAPKSRLKGVDGVGGLTEEKAPEYKIAMNPGQGKPTVYALQTCRHCVKMREFLGENNIEYDIIYVDSFVSEAKENIMEKVRQLNPRGSYPTLVATDGRVVVGYREQLMREVLLNDSGNAA